MLYAPRPPFSGAIHELVRASKDTYTIVREILGEETNSLSFWYTDDPFLVSRAAISSILLHLSLSYYSASLYLSCFFSVINHAQVSLSSLRILDLGQPLGSWLLRSRQPCCLQDAHCACLEGLLALGATPLAPPAPSTTVADVDDAASGMKAPRTDNGGNEGDARRVAALQSAKMALGEGALGFEIWSEIMDADKPEPFLATITRKNGSNSKGIVGNDSSANNNHAEVSQGSWAAAKLLVGAFTAALVGDDSNPKTDHHHHHHHKKQGEDEPRNATDSGGGGGSGGRVHTVPAAALALIEHWAACAPKVRQDATRARGIELKKDLVAALGEDGIAVWPSLPHLAPRHGGEVTCVGVSLKLRLKCDYLLSYGKLVML